MSYCRWSCGNGQSDLYVYEHTGGGWSSHVAGRRPKDPERVPGTSIEEIVADSEDSSLWLDLSEIGPEAGQTYNDPTPGECAARLRTLKAKGFNVPDYMIERLEAEAAGGEG